MKTFLLKGKGQINDLPFALNDLIPVTQIKEYSFTDLANLINYRDYYSDTNWTNEDYISLYKIPANHGHDFFIIRDTGIVVIPGTCIFPTLLSEDQILNGL